jgi:hypothetical protein
MRLAPLLLAILPLAAPAAAQIAGRPVYDPVPRTDRLGAVESRIAVPGVLDGRRGLRDRIDEARDSRRISRGEARAYRREARAIGVLARRFGRDGLSPSEVTELRFRVQVLDSALSRSTPSDR